ncbi:MAG: PLP-dependent aminotransferase family protein [Inhella sp.]
MFAIDRTSSTPLADQIEQRLGGLIQSGQLPQGARLMSIRQLAQQLGVSVNTVVLAYERLAASGLVDSQGTAGTFVRRAAAPMPDAAAIEAGEAQEPVWLAQQAHDVHAGLLLASSGALPASWLQDAVPASTVARALAHSPAGMATRCPPQGLPELRERLAQQLRAQGIAVDAGRVLTTFGGTHAIDLICRALLRPGDAVLVENPGYFLMFSRLRELGLRLVPVTRRPEGIDLEELDAACRVHQPRLLFTQTVLHNPTGWGSSPAHLHRLLVLAQRHGFLIAEDDVQGHFHPGQPTRLAALSGLERVIYYSSFCKAVSPALRVGYLAAEPTLLRALLREKIHQVLTGAALNELVFQELLAAGRWRKHLERLQRKLAAARHHSLGLLRQAGLRIEVPGEGGLFLWAQLPAGVDPEALVQDAYRQQILLVRGATFMADGAGDTHLRFNVAQSQHPRLAAYLNRYMSRYLGEQPAAARSGSADTRA